MRVSPILAIPTLPAPQAVDKQNANNARLACCGGINIIWQKSFDFIATAHCRIHNEYGRVLTKLFQNCEGMDGDVFMRMDLGCTCQSRGQIRVNKVQKFCQGFALQLGHMRHNGEDEGGRVGG